MESPVALSGDSGSCSPTQRFVSVAFVPVNGNKATHNGNSTAKSPLTPRFSTPRSPRVSELQSKLRQLQYQHTVSATITTEEHAQTPPPLKQPQLNGYSKGEEQAQSESSEDLQNELKASLEVRRRLLDKGQGQAVNNSKPPQVPVDHMTSGGERKVPPPTLPKRLSFKDHNDPRDDSHQFRRKTSSLSDLRLNLDFEGQVSSQSNVSTPNTKSASEMAANDDDGAGDTLPFTPRGVAVKQLQLQAELDILRDQLRDEKEMVRNLQSELRLQANISKLQEHKQTVQRLRSGMATTTSAPLATTPTTPTKAVGRDVHETPVKDTTEAKSVTINVSEKRAATEESPATKQRVSMSPVKQANAELANTLQKTVTLLRSQLQSEREQARQLEGELSAQQSLVRSRDASPASAASATRLDSQRSAGSERRRSKTSSSNERGAGHEAATVERGSGERERTEDSERVRTLTQQLEKTRRKNKKLKEFLNRQSILESTLQEPANAVTSPSGAGQGARTSSLLRQLDELNQEMDLLEQEVHSKDRQIEHMSSELRKKDAFIAKQGESLTLKSDCLRKLASEAKSTATKFKDNLAETRLLRAELARLQGDLQQSSKVTADQQLLESHVAELQQQNKQLRQQLSQATDDSKRLKLQVHELEKQLNENEAAHAKRGRHGNSRNGIITHNSINFDRGSPSHLSTPCVIGELDDYDLLQACYAKACLLVQEMAARVKERIHLHQYASRSQSLDVDTWKQIASGLADVLSLNEEAREVTSRFRSHTTAPMTTQGKTSEASLVKENKALADLLVKYKKGYERSKTKLNDAYTRLKTLQYQLDEQQLS